MVKVIAIIPGGFKPPHIGHYTLVQELLKDKNIEKIFIIISKKSRDDINAEQSEKIWNIYKDTLKDKDKNRVFIFISKNDSPLITAMGIAKQYINKKYKVILIKSKKDESNKRFVVFKKMKGIIIKVLPAFKTVSSTNMREVIKEGDEEKFIKFIPKEIKENNREKIWRIVKKYSN